MTHDQVRASLSAGERSGEVEAHLAECTGCSTWLRSLERVRSAAAGAMPPAPDGLSDRVLAAVRAAAPAAAAFSVAHGAAGGPPLVPWWRRVGGRAAVAAALAGAVVAGALTIPGESEDAALVAAATATEQAQTARVRVEAGFTAELPVPVRIDLGEAERLAGELREAHLDLPKAPREVRAQMEAMLREQQRMLERVRDAVKIEPRIIEVTMTASGAVVLPDRMHLKATIDAPAFVAASGAPSGETELVVIGDRAWIRPAGTGAWYVLPAGAGAVSIVLDASPILDLMRRQGGAIPGLGHIGSVSDEGVETLDGERVRRFLAKGTALAGGASLRLELWIGEDDGILRRMRSEQKLPAAPVRSSSYVDVRLSDFGADVTVEEPSPVSDDPAPAGTVAFGFGAGSLTFALHLSAPMRPVVRPVMPPPPAPAFTFTPAPPPATFSPYPHPYPPPGPHPEPGGEGPPPPAPPPTYEPSPWEDPYGGE